MKRYMVIVEFNGNQQAEFSIPAGMPATISWMQLIASVHRQSFTDMIMIFSGRQAVIIVSCKGGL